MEQQGSSGGRGGFAMRWWMWLVGVAALLVLVAVIISQVNLESLSRTVEHRMNSRLKGYRVSIGGTYFKLLPLSVGFRDVKLIQTANPDPPVLDARWVYGTVHWRALIFRRIVGALSIGGPKLHINLAHIREEEKSKVPLKEKGWQEALKAILPIYINLITVRGGELTYIDEGPARPLKISGFNADATNIRNISVPDKTYPSGIRATARVFDKGSLTISGRANFLEEPFPGIKADVELADLDLTYVAPVAKRANITIRKGSLAAKGAMEYSPKITDVRLERLDITGADVDYVTLPRTAGEEKERARAVGQTAKKAGTESTAKLSAGEIKISRSTVGFIDKSVNPPFRLYIGDLNMVIRDFSNRFAQGPARLDLKGKFMGTGDTRISGTFLPEGKSPQFNLKVAIENTQMPPMSDLFRAYGDFEIESGFFSLYSDIAVKDNMVKGFVKPLFKDLKVEDRQKKGPLHKLYVGAVKGVTKLLKNKPRQQVATETDLSGPLEGPRPDTWQAIVNLVRNAFVKAIVPGFQRETASAGG